MDQTTNPLDSILQLSHADSIQVCHFQQQNFGLFNNAGCSLNIDYKQAQKNQFFAISPKPFCKSNTFNHQLQNQHYYRNQINRSQQIYLNNRLNLQDHQNFFKWFGSDKQSEIYNQQSPYLNKKNEFSQFSFKFEKIQTQKKQQYQVKNQDLVKQEDQSFIQNQMKLPKHEKGLKYLSNSVYQILKNKQKTTFNNVAKLLVQGLKKKAFQQDKQFDERQQKNIKRRAYDALNVMIAAQIIEKQDKFIYLKSSDNKTNTKNQSNPCKNKRTKVSNLTKIRSNLVDDLDQITHRIQLKRLQVQNLQQRKMNIESFIEQKIINQHKPDQRIYFPFLCIETYQQNFISVTKQGHKQFINDQKQNSSTCDQYPSQNSIYLNFKYCQSLGSNLLIEGDTDLITKIGKQIRKQQNSLPSTQIQSLSLNC